MLSLCFTCEREGWLIFLNWISIPLSWLALVEKFFQRNIQLLSIHLFLASSHEQSYALAILTAKSRSLPRSFLELVNFVACQLRNSPSWIIIVDRLCPTESWIHEKFCFASCSVKISFIVLIYIGLVASHIVASPACLGFFQPFLQRSFALPKYDFIRKRRIKGRTRSLRLEGSLLNGWNDNNRPYYQL